jgi:hypothetical protein
MADPTGTVTIQPAPNDTPMVIEPAAAPATALNNNYTTVTNGDGTTTVTFSDGSTATYSGFGTDAEKEISTTAPSNASGTKTSATVTDTTGSSTGSGTGNGGNGDTGTGSGAGTGKGTGSSILPTPATNAIQPDLPTEIVPNPLSQFASYSYAWSLWWLDVGDYNNLVGNITDVGPGLSTPLGPNSYVVAEDSGLYPTRRLPTQLGLNYQIQRVEFDTAVGLNSSSKSSNMITGSMTILEPYGVTWVDSLVAASYKNNQYQNWMTQPFMLQLDFTGYDDSGAPLAPSLTALYRKRFPIKFTKIGINVGTKGAEYAVSFYPSGHETLYPELSSTPKDFTVTAGTVKDFFDPKSPTSFTGQLNKFYQDQVTHSERQYASVYSFDFDPLISASKIVYDKQLSLNSSNPNTTGGIDLTKSSFTIPAKTQITEIINRVLIQSEYLQSQLGVNLQGLTQDQINQNAQVKANLVKTFQTFKTTARTQYSGADASGAVQQGVFDNIKNKYAQSYNYAVRKYTVYDPIHPATPFLTDSRSNTLKNYNYIYTGKNTDIIDFKLNFDTTWYVPIATHTRAVAETNVSGSTLVNTTLANAPAIILSPQLLAASAIPQFGQLTNLTPMRVTSTVNNPNNNIGFGTINNPGSQVAADVLNTVYSRPTGDMVTLDLTILGDPTLVKQDDWLYTPSPLNGSLYNDISVNQAAFAKKYGHLRMDVGQLIAKVTVNTPLDIDTDWTNTGLVFPNPGVYPSLFSGQYKILTIKNTFENGKFIQVLRMVRVMNNDLINKAPPDTQADRTGSVTTSQTNQNGTNNSVQPAGSNSTPAGEAGFDANGQVNTAGDATRYGGG